MRRLLLISIAFVLLLTLAASAQNTSTGTSNQPSSAAADDNAQLRQELEQMKKSVAALEERLAAQEKKEEVKQQATGDQANTSELVATVKDLDHRISQTERRGALDRVNLSGDYRFEAHSIWGNVPAHFDGMQLQTWW